jgi:HK97 gp10 family phage protein
MAAKILGLAKLDAKLKRLPTAPRDEIRAALGKQAARIVAMAKGLVPVQDAADGGKLQRSIGWTFGKAPRGSISLGKIVSAALGGDLTVTIYAGNDEAFYARWVEFGTQPHAVGAGSDITRGRQSGAGHPGTAAQPFFFPSYRANRKAAKRAVTTAVRKAARKVAAS